MEGGFQLAFFVWFGHAEVVPQLALTCSLAAARLIC